ncbi:MAG: hypothetical protein CW346_19685, partial [Bacillaceae bacterium]|nr:hypothetical protein [Bacillaceae bacterium]
PTLVVTFLPRPVHSLRVVGDSARGEYPVDFIIRLYNAESDLLHEEVVTGNTEVVWTRRLEEPITSVTRMELEIRRWSHPGRVVKILEFFTSVQQTYLAGDILEISLIEEREVSQNTLPVGSISANEIKIRLSNEDRRFDADNAQSPLYELLKPNRRIRAWLAAVLPDGTEEYVPLGLFWSTEWQAEDDTVEASVVARDRLELLRKSTYQTSQVLQNTNLHDLAVLVLADAGLDPEEYWVDPALQQIRVPYAWFDPVSHREALRIIAEAGLAQVYCDRDGVVRMERQPAGADPVLEITADDYYRLSNPMRPNQVANEVIVSTSPLRPADMPEEVYRSNEPIMVPAGKAVTVTVYYQKTPVIDAIASLDGAPAGVAITQAAYYGWGAEMTIQNT